MDKIKNWLVYKILEKIILSYLSIIRHIYHNRPHTISVIKEHYKERYFEKKLGEDTVGERNYKTKEDHSIYKDMMWYQPCPFDRLEKIIDCLKLNNDDIFIDFGSGKGRVIFLVAMRRLKKVIGVEYNANMVDAARRNLNKLKLNKTPIEIINADAATFDVKNGTAFFLFNPFGAKTLAKIVENIKNSLIANPRKICIVYCYPVYRYLLEIQDWLILEKETSYYLIYRNTSWQNNGLSLD